MNNAALSMRACPCCGLVQSVPFVPARMRACCARCGTSLVRQSVIVKSNSRTAALATAGLILYPFAVGLPVMEIERLGHVRDASIVDGVTNLLAHGDVFVGLVVLVCSIVLPFGKLATLLVLAARGRALRGRHAALAYHLVEWTGRWGMLDVLLLAVLVAVVKLGDMVTVAIGPATLAFTVCVLLSLLAAASFDPHALWEADE